MCCHLALPVRTNTWLATSPDLTWPITASFRHPKSTHTVACYWDHFIFWILLRVRPCNKCVSPDISFPRPPTSTLFCFGFVMSWLQTYSRALHHKHQRLCSPLSMHVCVCAKAFVFHHIWSRLLITYYTGAHLKFIQLPNIVIVSFIELLHNILIFISTL